MNRNQATILVFTLLFLMIFVIFYLFSGTTKLPFDTIIGNKVDFHWFHYGVNLLSIVFTIYLIVLLVGEIDCKEKDSLFYFLITKKENDNVETDKNNSVSPLKKIVRWIITLILIFYWIHKINV